MEAHVCIGCASGVMLNKLNTVTMGKLPGTQNEWEVLSHGISHKEHGGTCTYCDTPGSSRVHCPYLSKYVGLTGYDCPSCERTVRSGVLHLIEHTAEYSSD